MNTTFIWSHLLCLQALKRGQISLFSINVKELLYRSSLRYGGRNILPMRDKLMGFLSSSSPDEISRGQSPSPRQGISSGRRSAWCLNDLSTLASEMSSYKGTWISEYKRELSPLLSKALNVPGFNTTILITFFLYIKKLFDRLNGRVVSVSGY